MKLSPANLISAVLVPFAVGLGPTMLAESALAQRTGLGWATYLGGSGTESSLARCLTPDGDIVIAGYTDSGNFPVQNAYRATYGGPSASGTYGFGDGFVARLSRNGRRLVWSTYLGGSAEDAVLGVVADAAGVIVCGVTRSANFPRTPGAFQQTLRGSTDGFVARFVWNGQKLQLLWSTYLGGSSIDTITGMAVHPSGSIVVSGATYSSDFPMRGQPYQSALAGNYDGFVAVLDATGSNLLASTYLGGSLSDSAWTCFPWPSHILWGFEVVLDHAGNPVVAGISSSVDFPTTPNAFQPVAGGAEDGVVVRLDLALSRLTYGTYLGAGKRDLLATLAMTPKGYIGVSGATASPGYPTTPLCFDSTYDPTTTCAYGDGCVTVLDTRATGNSQLAYSSFYGGTGCDHAMSGLAVDSRGQLLIGGFSSATNLPTTPGAYQRNRAGSSDGYLAYLDPRQVGANQLRYGTYLGGSGNYDLVGGILPDGMGNAIVIGATVGSFPATSGCFQTTFGGRQDLFVAELNLLPQGVTRYGWSTRACLHPIFQTVDSWPVAGNFNFTLEVEGAPPNTAGLLAFGARDTRGWKPFPYLAAFVSLPLWKTVAVTTNPQGRAQYSLPIPPVVTTTPPHGIATQWFFGTTAGCPGSGLLSASEGLGW